MGGLERVGEEQKVSTDGSPTPRCSVALVGEDRDIEELAKHFDDMKVGWIRGDAQSGWTFSSADLERVTGREDVLCVARDTIEYQDKVMYVNHPGYAGVAVGNVVYTARTGGKDVTVEVRDNITMSLSWQLSSEEPLCPHAVARAAKADGDVQKVLKWLTGLEGDWMALYDLAEAMGKVLPKRPSGLKCLREFSERGWISQDEAKHFKTSANMARHPASASGDIPMRLSDGQSLMRRVARKLLLDMLEVHDKPDKPQ